ncbi:hypothetical protein YT1_0708 [Rhodococcus ruber]|nr:hypothetical protein YT1_0708 [Rhodococcus ruber]
MWDAQGGARWRHRVGWLPPVGPRRQPPPGVSARRRPGWDP